jgi:hypothetical protein
MMYVSQEFRVSNDVLADRIQQLGEDDPSVDILLMVDFVFHHQDDDYDGGLSFLDRIYTKLRQFHPDWNVAVMKETIRTANDPVTEYLYVIDTMLGNADDRFCYGM